MSLGSADWSHALNGTANRHFKCDLTANSGPPSRSFSAATGQPLLVDRIFRRVVADLGHGVEPLRVFQIIQG